jgi:hypothetical protein
MGEYWLMVFEDTVPREIFFDLRGRNKSNMGKTA